MIGHYQESFAGLPVCDYTSTDTGADADDLPPAESAAWRIATNWDDSRPFPELWTAFLDTVAADRVRAVIIGDWWGDDGYSDVRPVLDALIASADRLPALRGLFLADVMSEQCQLSWLRMDDVAPVLEAYPRLEEFTVRGCGSGGLAFRPVRHERLRVLRFESGGLPGEVVRAVGASELPRLEHLALWLGVEQYGGDATVADLAPVLSGARFPALTHLGLQDSELQDEIAAAVASAPVVAQLASLDLSMGTLGDAGAEALLTGQPLTHLLALDLHHHYLSDAMMRRVCDALEPSGVEVNVAEQEEPDRWDDDDDGEEEEYRYVAVSE
ncbi:STM4015 family protein [Streptomyces botrytidirepellens]|uniref:STM4015 family protein n=1 Tax=Streptomyces botrytidirepellens TaxID=2486417 RepID=UPI0016160AFD|nr:STM4015 family protein [Streptomyces botrytidirepellens]